MSATLRDIRLFVAAYEERSFTAAAAREHATQSGISQHVRNLEDRLGVQLFLREKGRVTPTPAGSDFYQHGIEVLRAHSSALQSAAAYTQGLTGEITVGLMPTATRRALAPALARFMKEHPNTMVRVVEGFSGLLTQQVQAGELDFSVVPACEDIPGVKQRLMLRTQEILVTGPDSGLPHRCPVELSELEPLSLVMPSKRNTRRHSLETYIASNDIKLERMIQLDSIFGSLDLVTKTEWSAILPAVLMADVDNKYTSTSDFTLNPIVNPTMWLDLVVIEPASKAMSPEAEAFLGILEEELRQLEAQWQQEQR